MQAVKCIGQKMLSNRKLYSTVIKMTPSFINMQRKYCATRLKCQDENSKDISPEVSTVNQNKLEEFDIPGVKSPGDKLALIFTCKVCDTRSVKKISKQAYTFGCVVVRCPKCENLHLIADRKGIFEDSSWDIKKYLESQGENVKVVTDEKGVLELTHVDIVGGSFASIDQVKCESEK